MGKCILNDGTILEDYGKPYIVAEVNSSHNGDVNTAKKMIDEAKKAGCNCVKFQSWSADTLYSKTYYDSNPIAKKILKKFSMNEDSLLEIAQYCSEKEIAFASTPYSKQEVDFLINNCNVPYIKIASMDINNYQFIDYIAQSGAPIILSTGMAEIEEIRKAVKIIDNAGNHNLSLLHCVSIYPAELSTIRLHNILGLRDEFPEYPIGFSDHSLGTTMSIAAIALGSAMIEKHFTLDKTKMGMDNNMAIESEEMKRLVEECYNVHLSLGSRQRIVSELEVVQRKKMRRSVVAAERINVGDKITANNIDVKRPGDGMSPTDIENIIGMTALCDIEKDTIIKREYLKC